MSDDTRNIYQRLMAVMAELKYIQKDASILKKDLTVKYKAVSHDHVTAKVREFFLKHGIICFTSVREHEQQGNRTTLLLDTTFMVADNPEDKLVVSTVGQGNDNEDKGPGKATSYGFKYALLKTLMLETGEDSDLEQVPYEPTAAPEKATTDHVLLIGRYLSDLGASVPEMGEAIMWRYGKSVRDMNGKEREDVLAWASELDEMPVIGGTIGVK